MTKESKGYLKLNVSRTKWYVYAVRCIVALIFQKFVIVVHAITVNVNVLKNVVVILNLVVRVFNIIIIKLLTKGLKMFY
jgi:hypothetical protein